MSKPEDGNIPLFSSPEIMLTQTRLALDDIDMYGEIATIKVADLEDNIPKGLAVSDVALNDSREMSSITLSAFDVEMRPEFLSTLSHQPEQNDPVRVLSSFGLVELEGLGVTIPGEPPFSIENAQLTTELDSQGRLSQLDFSGSSSQEIPDFRHEAVDLMRALVGSDAITSTLVMSVAFDNDERTITIDPFTSVVEDALEVDFSANLSNIDLIALAAAPDLASSGVSFDRVNMGLRDLGGVERLLAHVAEQQGMTADVLKQMMRSQLSMVLPQLGISSTGAQAIVSMLEEPGQKLTVDITTPSGFNLAEAQYQAMMNPMALAQNVSVEINVEK